MRVLLSALVLVATLDVLRSAAEDNLSNGLSEDTLKQLSLDGEKLVDEEVRRALYGVKEMKETMTRNERKHEQLMKSLRSSSEKQQGAAQLTQEVTERLDKAEQECRDSLQPEWERCRPCLEEACKTFYTSTCRRGFRSFHAKVKNLFHSVSGRFGARQPAVEAGDIVVNQDPEGRDAEVAHVEETFGRVTRKVCALVERSVSLVSRMSGRLDGALQKAFSSGASPEPEEDESPSSAPEALDPARDSGFLQGVGLEEVLDSFFDFGRSVVEEFGAVVATEVFDDLNASVLEESKKGRGRGLFPRLLQNRRLCRDLRRQTSECWQLQDRCEACQGALLRECPSVRELHTQLDEASQLLDACRDQYEEILAVVRRHTDETVGWLTEAAAEVSWVVNLATGNGTGPQKLFRVTMVLPKESDAESASVSNTEVQVNILNSPPLTFSVPGELDLQEPAFIQYVTQEALGKYKETTTRLEEDEEDQGHQSHP